MANTLDQFWDRIRYRVREMILDILAEEGVYNHQAYPHGKVASVAADGKHADVYINAATTATAAVPIAPHVGTLAVNDEVIILRRAPRDLLIISKKVL